MIRTMGVEQTVRRGEIHWVKGSTNSVGSEMKKDRPALVVSNNQQNSTATTIQVVFLTSQPKKNLPTHVILGKTSNGKADGSTVLCENIYSISKERLQDNSYMARVSDHDMEAIDWALITSLALEDYCYQDDFEPEDSEGVMDSGGVCTADDVMDDGKMWPEEPDMKQELEKVQMEAEFYKNQYEALLERIMQKAKI